MNLLVIFKVKNRQTNSTLIKYSTQAGLVGMKMADTPAYICRSSSFDVYHLSAVASLDLGCVGIEWMQSADSWWQDH